MARGGFEPSRAILYRTVIKIHLFQWSFGLYKRNSRLTAQNKKPINAVETMKPITNSKHEIPRKKVLTNLKPINGAHQIKQHPSKNRRMQANFRPFVCFMVFTSISSYGLFFF